MLHLIESRINYKLSSLLGQFVSYEENKVLWIRPIEPSLRVQVQPGSTKANGRQPKTCLGLVFNYKLGCYDDVHVLYYVDAWPSL